MIMNFTRMLDFDWLLFNDMSLKTTNTLSRLKYGKDFLLAYYNKYLKKAEHDQKLLNIMFHFNPGTVQLV